MGRRLYQRLGKKGGAHPEYLEEKPITYALNFMLFNPTRCQGGSEKLILSHYENNYGGAVKRLNAIGEPLRSLDFATAPVFVINGLKREEGMAASSMILHERYFESLSGCLPDFISELP